MRWVNCVFTEAVEMDRAAQRATGVVLTSRLRLTPIGPADVDELIVLYRDPLVAFWTGPWSPATVQAWAAEMATRWNMEGVGKWLARSRSDALLVGRGGFTRFDLHGESVLELGWVVRDALTGRGYATEIGRAALDWAVIHEPRAPIVAFTEVHNQASQAVNAPPRDAASRHDPSHGTRRGSPRPAFGRSIRPLSARARRPRRVRVSQRIAPTVQ